MPHARRPLLALLALLAPLASPTASGFTAPPRPAPHPAPTVQAPLPARARPATRALWVTRFDYRTREDVVRAVDAAASAGFDAVLFQVRGNATAFYRSSLEPWAQELGGADPGFDPLQVAIDAARERGIALHAWFNVMPAWWGTDLPSDPKQLWNARKEWLWYDQRGAPQPLSDRFYVSVNPCLPEVRRYLGDVVRDLVARYAIDGLHLDYVRFPNEPPGTPAGSGSDYPRDERTLALYQKATGKAPDDDRKAWDAWRCEQVTAVVRDVARIVREVRPEAELSAAVGPDLAKALHHFQDVRTWLREGLVDALYPMNYTADPKTFAARLAAWKETAGATPVVMGLRVHDDAGLVRSQIEASSAAFRGWCLFAYSSIFDSPNTAIDEQDPATRKAREARREKLVPLLREVAAGKKAAR